MLVIRREQMLVFEGGVREQLIESLVEHATTHFPMHAQALGRMRVRDVVDRALARAESAGVTDAGDAGDFISMVFVFGDQFPDGAAFGWARALLDDPAQGSISTRVGFLRVETEAVLSRLAALGIGGP